MKIENRGQLIEALRLLSNKSHAYTKAILTGWPTEIYDSQKEYFDCRDQLLDALFPKTESHRLKRLKSDKHDIENFVWTNKAHETAMQLLDAAIKEEEAKS